MLSLRVGLAVSGALEAACPGTRLALKWPNDLVLTDRKVGGILCEARWQGGAPGWVAVGLANLVNILDPEIIVLGGGLVTEADLFLASASAAFAELVLAGPHRPEVPIVAASTGERAGALGAALLAAERH